ncbi:homoserine dehydrogenase-domain-containing protein [Syncephalis fuscata]|nr:homoserine dehydrogenase-domain-containing protein [Syncephalis fuscata]
MLTVGIVGCGLVGAELVDQLLAGSRRAAAPLKVAALARSRTMLLASGEHQLSSDTWRAQLASTTEAEPADLEHFARHLASHAPACIVDCTSDNAIASLYPEWLRLGLSIVTPNKKAFSGDLSLLKTIRAIADGKPGHPIVRHESTVGAGLPVLSTLEDLVATGDRISRIEGVFSGTLSYLFNRYAAAGNNERFSDIVKEAKQLGYTEPDPRDDLNGMDVARKVVILARTAGLDISLDQVAVENIVPEALRDAPSADAFLSRLSDYDEHFAQLRAAAHVENKTLRYVGLVDLTTGTASVTLARYPTSHPLAGLTGSDNMVAFTTARFPSPLIIQGAGAGAAVTAFGCYADLLKIHAATARI